jgi:hypothetical protein
MTDWREIVEELDGCGFALPPGAISWQSRLANLAAKEGRSGPRMREVGLHAELKSQSSSFLAPAMVQA